MKRRVLAMFLVLVMIFSMMPTTALAKEVDASTPIDQLEVGDTFWAADENATLPVLPDSTWSWVGPEQYLVCSLTEHEHRTGNRNSCYTDNCERRNHEHCYSDTCTNTDADHEHCYALTCGYAAHAHSDECYNGYVWTIGGPTTSTISFKIVNGTWSGLSLGDDAYLSDDGTTVTFTVTVWEPYGYVYKCGGTMETFLSAILGNDNSLGSGYIVPDTGYTLEGMDSQDWEVESGGLTGSSADADAQMEEIKGNIHGYDDNMTPSNGFQYNTVYVLTLTKSSYTYTGTIDNGGTVTNGSQTGLAYESTSQAMVFTPAEGYEIVGVTVSVNKGTPVSYAEYAGSYTLAADGSFTFPAETVIHDIDVVVTTAQKTYTVTWENEDSTVLETDTGVPYGSTPSYDGETPTKASDAQYHYEFVGWQLVSGTLTEDGGVASDLVYVAVFQPAGTRSYTVTWVNYNRVTLETDQSVPYGTTVKFVSGAAEGGIVDEKETYANFVSYGGATPTRDADSHYTYTFVGWEVYEGSAPVDGKTTGSVTFIAVFEPHEILRTATVEVILNGTADSANEIVTGGEHRDISDMVTGADNAIYLSADGSSYITLSKTATGVYSYTGIADGDYAIYARVGGSYVRIGTQILTIANADRTRYLPYYSVEYVDGEANGAATNMPVTEYYYIGSHVDVSTLVPQWSGHNFLYWTEGSASYEPSTALETVRLDSSITQAHTLVAQWEDTVNVDVIVKVTHGEDDHYYTGDLDIHLTQLVGGNYTEYPGSLVSVPSSSWYAPENGVSTYELVGRYVDLDAEGDYSAHAALVGYEHVKTDVRYDDATDTYIVTIELVFDPDGFELQFEVRVDGNTPEVLVPGEVDVKVTYWNAETNAWEPIGEHEHDTIAVAIDQKAEDDSYYYGTGSVHVWGFQLDGTTPYLYRIEVISLDAIAGSYSLVMAEGSEDKENVEYTSVLSGFFPAGAYKGTIYVDESCASGKSNSDRGLYGTHAAKTDAGLVQHDGIYAWIDVTPYDIDLMMNDGTDVKFADIDDRFTVPALDSYVPTREGFTFDGWYTEDGTKVSGGEYINELAPTLELGGTLVLYAKWKADFTVKGTVVVDLIYPCTDTGRTVKVALQYRNAGGTVYVTQREVTVSLLPVAGTAYASGEYEFTDVPDTGEYRVVVIIENGGTVYYQNEPDSLVVANLYDKDAYNLIDYVVDPGTDDPSVAVVNIFMKADTFELGYMVDASAIGEGFRPTTVNLDLRHDHSDGSYETIATLPAVEDEKGINESDIATIPVPPYHANGYLYDYVISTISWVNPQVNDGRLTEHHHYLNDPAAQKTFAPFVIRYTGPANYRDTANSDDLYQDVTLKAIFEPNSYDINYVLNGGHWGESVTPVRVHTWSFETNVNLSVPVRDGYVFTGWTVDKPENYVDGKIPASVWENVTLTANWEKDTIVDPDEPDPNPNKPGDGVPDKYQVEVYYKATAGGSVDPTYDVITLRDSGNLVEALDSASVRGSTATAGTDYVFDGWTDSHSNASYDRDNAVSGTVTISNVKGGEVYTFTANFAEDKKGGPGPDGIADKYQVFVEFYSAGNGTVEGEGIYQTFTFKPETSGDVTPSLDNVDVTPADGYAFDIWTKDNGNLPVNPETTLVNVPGGTTIKFYAHFAKDELEDPGKDPDPDKPGDGIPDKYQATVTYKVVSGYWSDDTNADKLAVFTLYYKDETTNGAWAHVMPLPTLGDNERQPVPTGMYPDAAHTGEGQWDEDIDSDTVVMGNAIYTYTFGTAVAPAVDIEKTVDAGEDGKAVVGDTVVYTITVKNTGNIDLVNLTVTESFGGDISKATVTVPDGVTKVSNSEYKIAFLKVNEIVEIIIEYVVTADDIDANTKTGTLSNYVKVESEDEYDTTPEDPTDPDKPVTDEDKTPDLPVEEQKPGIDVEKSTEQSSVSVGETIEWTITVENIGNVKLEGIKLSDTLSGAAGSAKLYYGDTEIDPASYTFDLEVGGSESFTAKYLVQAADAGKEINNTIVAEIPGEGPKDEDTPEDPIKVKNPGLNVTKAADRTTAYAGDTIKWTITVSNSGNVDLSDISLSDTLYADGVAIGSLELSDADGNVVTAIAELKVGQSVTLYASYLVKTADIGKDIKNVATATTPDGPSDEGESGETEIIDPYIPTPGPSGPELNKEDHVAYIIGYPDGTVQPQGNITRAEVATIFFRLLTDASRTEYWSKSNPYSDVSIDKWYNNAISTLSNADIITGYPDGSFRPNAPITRAEFAAIAARFSEVIYNGGNSFTDVPENHWAARYIALAEHLGWVNGYPDGSFKPDQAITRAEAMTLINRVLEREVEEEHLLRNMITWVDNQPGTWYYEAVQEATNSHTYVRLSKVVPGHDFCYEDWIEILPVPDWAALEKAWSDANDHR